MMAAKARSHGTGVMARRLYTWEAKDERVPGAEIFLLNRNPERPHVVQDSERLVYLGPGLAQRSHAQILVRRPSDEPTANLDSHHGREVMRELRRRGT